MFGQPLGHYRIDAKIGEGGMGVVYRARDEFLHRDVALKVLSKATVSTDTAREFRCTPEGRLGVFPLTSHAKQSQKKLLGIFP
jgi:serine/threonine protein kinase